MAKPRRTDEEKIEDAFCDLDLEDQAKMLESLAKLNRWCWRERNRKPESNGKPTGKPVGLMTREEETF